MGTLKDLQSVYGIIAGLGFPFCMFLIIVGSYFGIFYWKRDVVALEKRLADSEAKCQALKTEKDEELDEQKTDYERRITRLENSVDKWQQVALTATPVLEKAADILRTRAA